MPSVNVQFREDEATIAFLARKGIRASALAKEAFEREVRRLRAEEHAAELARLGVTLPKGSGASAVRAGRDAR